MGKFKNSPLTQFITPTNEPTATTPRPATHTTRPPRPRKSTHYVAPADYDTPRSKRVQLLFRPAFYDEIKAIARNRKQSINNFIEDVLTEFMEQCKGGD